MKFSAREDIEAPIDYVFGQVSDIGAFERQALRRGADVRRLDHGAIKQGSSWQIAFKFRGKERRFEAILSTLDAPNMMEFDIKSPNIKAICQVELVPLSLHRTRIAMSIEISPKTLSARLLLQSLKLAKANLTTKFKNRVADFSQDVEDRFRTGA